MIIKLRFYKENDRWYADVPDHTQEENEMVFGSDTFLDLISNGKSEITFTISDEKIVVGFNCIWKIMMNLEQLTKHIHQNLNYVI